MTTASPRFVLFLAILALVTVAGLIIDARPAAAAEPQPTFTARMNPTGTHIRDGRLVVRIDLYPTPAAKSYASQRVMQPERPYTEHELASYTLDELTHLVPQVEVTNPALCHFLTLPANTSAGELTDLVRALFDPKTVAILDDDLSKATTDLGAIQATMSTKAGYSTDRISTKEAATVKALANTRLADLAIDLEAENEA